MLATILLTVALGGGAPPEPPAARLKVFGDEEWYQSQPGKEQEFVGVLERVGRKGGALGFDRFNPFRLVMDSGKKRTVREVYAGGQPDLLAPYVGKKVKLLGKAVAMEVEGSEHHEIWPARLELGAEGKTSR